MNDKYVKFKPAKKSLLKFLKLGAVIVNDFKPGAPLIVQGILTELLSSLKLKVVSSGLFVKLAVKTRGDLNEDVKLSKVKEGN